jgi:hypothetical protein
MHADEQRRIAMAEALQQLTRENYGHAAVKGKDTGEAGTKAAVSAANPLQPLFDRV